MSFVHPNGYEVFDAEDLTPIVCDSVEEYNQLFTIKDIEKWDPQPMGALPGTIPQVDWTEEVNDDLLWSQTNPIKVCQLTDDGIKRIPCNQVLRRSQYLKGLIQLWPTNTPHPEHMRFDISNFSIDDFVLMWNIVDLLESPMCVAIDWCPVRDHFVDQYLPFAKRVYANEHHAVFEARLTRITGHFVANTVSDMVYFLSTFSNGEYRWIMFTGQISGRHFCDETDRMYVRQCRRIYRSLLTTGRYLTQSEEDKLMSLNKIPNCTDRSRFELWVDDAHFDDQFSDDEGIETNQNDLRVLKRTKDPKVKESTVRKCMWHCKGYSLFWRCFDEGTAVPVVCEKCGGEAPISEIDVRIERRKAVTESPPAKKIRKGYSMASQTQGRMIESVEKLRDRMEIWGGIRTSHKKRANRCDGPRFVAPSVPKRKLNRQKMRDQKYSMAALMDGKISVDQSVRDVVYRLAESLNSMSVTHGLDDVSQLFADEFLNKIGELLKEALLFVSLLLLVVLVYRYGWSKTAIAMLAGMIMTRFVFVLEIRKFFWTAVSKLTGDVGYLMASGDLEIPKFVPELLFGSLTAGFVGLLPTSKNFDSLCLRLDRIPKALKGLELLSHWIQEVFEHFKEFIRTKILGEAPLIKIDGGREDINAWIEQIKTMTDPQIMKNVQTDITLVGKAIDIYRQGLEFVKQIPNLPRELVEVVKTSQYAARKIYDAALQSAALTGAMRAKPVCAMFIGDTSIGKTGTVYPLAFDTCKALGLISPEQIRKNPKCWEPHMYARCSETEFFDGYNGQQIVWFDDAFQRKDDLANPNTEIFELIRMVNIFQYYLHMASLNEKSNTVFRGRAIFLTTNDYDMFFPSIQSKEAIISRISHPMLVTLKKEYQDETGRLDVKKVKADMKNPGLHLQINEYQLCTLTTDKRPQGYGPKMDYFEMSAMIQEAVKESVEDGHNLDKFMTDYAQLTPDEYKAKYLKTHTMAIGGELLEKARKWVKETTLEALNAATMETTFERREIHRRVNCLDQNGQLCDDVIETTEELYVDAVQCSEEDFQECRRRQIERQRERDDPDYISNASVLETSALMIQSWVVKARHRFEAAKQQWDELRLAKYDPELYVAKHPLMSKFVLLMTITIFALTVIGVWKLTKWAFKSVITVTKCVYGMTKNTFRKFYESKGYDEFQNCMKDPDVESVLSNCCNVLESPEGDILYLPEWVTPDSDKDLKDYKLVKKAYSMSGNGTSVGKHQKKAQVRMAGNGTSVGKQQRARQLRMACEMNEEEFLTIYYLLPDEQRKQLVAFVEDASCTGAFSNLEVVDEDTLMATAKDGTKIKCQLNPKTHSMALNDQTGTFAQYKANHNHWHFKYYWLNSKKKVMETEAGMAVAVHGRILMVPMHFKKAMDVKGDRLVGISVFDEHHPDGIPLDLESFKRGKQLISRKLSAEKQKDVFLFDAGRTFPTAKSLLKLWCTSDDIPKAHGLMGSFLTREVVPNSNQVINYMQRERVELIPNFDKKVTMEMEGQTIELQYAAMFQVPIGCQQGDCGAVLTINDKRMQRKFCGILTLIADYEEETLFTVINREELDETLKSFSDESLITLPEKFSMSHVDERDVTRVRLAKGNFTPIGVARPAPSGSKTALTESLIHGKVIETHRMPAKLKPDGEHDPLYTGLEKCGQPVVFIDTKLIDMAKKDVATLMNGATRKFFDINKYKRVLTFEEAVMGWDGDDFINSISRSTSPGYPWVFDKKPGTTGKQTWFGKDDIFDLTREECLILKRKCLEMLVTASRNERSDVIFIDTLKDELRLIEKVLQGKTRVFSAGPMHYTIVARQYFLGYCAWAQHHRIENQLAVGIRPFDLDWHNLALKLQTKGTGVVAGDFTNYDGTESAQILWAICDMINDWYDDGPTNARIRRVLFAEIAHGIHIADGNVYQWDRSLPSGNPFTAIFNSIYNLLAMRVVWLLMTGRSLMDFNKHVWMIAYGDDNVVNLSKFAQSIFSQDVMSEGFKRIGMTYTDETKTGTGLVRELGEITFLKRAFRFADDQGKYVAPLQFQTVLDQTNWIRNNENAVSATAMNVGVCVRELSLHGKEVFDEWYPKVRGVLTPQVLKETKLGSSYEDYLTMWLSGELEDEQWF